MRLNFVCKQPRLCAAFLFLALITQDVLLPPSTLTWMPVNSWEGNILSTVSAFNVIWSKWAGLYNLKYS